MLIYLTLKSGQLYFKDGVQELELYFLFLASGAIPEKRLREHTKRFAGGDKMVGVAAREIEERVERTRKPYWEQQGDKKKSGKEIIAPFISGKECIVSGI